jgi:hypothetical protein
MTRNGAMEMEIFIDLIVGYCALYAVFWLHEVGHGVVYAKYRCKKNPFQVHVPVHMFFSTPMPVDREKAKNLSRKQNFHVGIGGMAANLLFGVPVAFILLAGDFRPSIVYFFFYTFALFHLVEAASYMVINNLLLAGDMLAVQAYKPALRLPFFLAGLAVAELAGIMLVESPSGWRAGYLAAVAVLTLNMCTGRYLFARKNKTNKTGRPESER